MNGSSIAIVGMACRSAAGPNLAEFWRALLEGRECVGRHARIAAHPGPDGGHWVELTPQDDNDEFFDARFFGLSPREAESLEPQHRGFLEAAWETLEDAGYAPSVSGRRVGVFGGANFTSYFGLHAGDHLPGVLEGMLGADKDYLATRVAHHLGLQGPALTVQSACSSSLAAVHLARQSLILGECDAALAGGVAQSRPRLSRYYYTPGAMLSPDGACRPFDADAQGTVFTEALGMVLLMRLEDALSQGRRIYAVIRGSAINNDGGRKASYLAPSISGQARVISDALADAGAKPSELGYVEAHGTATVIGDAIELAALTRVFKQETDAARFCQIGSVKSNIGHAAAAAGVMGLIKTALALHHGALPPNAGFRRPNPDLEQSASPFFVGAATRAWEPAPLPRKAGVSCFGVGGTNVHAVLEEAPRTPRAARDGLRPEILAVSGRTEAAVRARARDLAAWAAEPTAPDLGDMAFTLGSGREALPHRAALVCGDSGEARRGLRAMAEGPVRLARDGGRTIAFMFPGQGAQHAGMGAGLYRDEPAFRETVDLCLARLDRDLSSELRPLLTSRNEAAEAALAETRLAQPALFIVEYALAELLVSWGLRPRMVIGHSLGEYAAACVSGALPLSAALRLVVRRGELMQGMAPGAMLAVAAAPDELADVLAGPLEVAARNGTRQTVLAGPEDAAERALAQLAARGYRAVRLKGRCAFHSAMVEPILSGFGQDLIDLELSAPSIPRASNLTGELIGPDDLNDPQYWVRHARAPVLFGAGLEALVRNGADLLVEVGPGGQLAGLARATGLARQGVGIVSTMPRDAEPTAETRCLLSALAQCWTDGADLDWPALYAGQNRRVVTLPGYPFERERFRCEPERATTPAADARLPEGAWLSSPTWRGLPVRSPVPPLARDESWLLVGGPADIRHALLSELEAQGRRVTAVDAEADEQMLARLAVEGAAPQRVVHLGLLTESRGTPAERTRSALACGVRALGVLVGALQRVAPGAPLQVDVVTSGALDVTGEEVLHPQAASAVAFVRTAPQETPGLTCRLLDVEADRVTSGIAVALGNALAATTPVVTALRAQRLWTEAFDPAPAPTESPPLKQGGVYLILGGLGHVGAAIGVHLARDWSARLVVSGRTAIPARSERAALLARPELDPAMRQRLERLSALEDEGGEVLYVQADIADPAAVARLRRETLAAFGRVDGLVYASGEVAAGAPAAGPWDEAAYEANLQAKADGLNHVMDAFAADPLDFGVVVSSISTVLGGLGHCPYAAANLVADAYVAQRGRHPGSPWRTVAWDLWAGSAPAGAPGAIRAGLAALAVQPDEGGRVFEAALATGAPRLIVSTHDLEARRARSTATLSSQLPGFPAPTQKRPYTSTAFAPLETDLERRLAAIWSRVLGIEGLGRDDDFFDMGGHSLLAVQAAAEIQRSEPSVRAAPNLYATPTLRTLAAIIEAAGAATAPSPAEVGAL